MDTKLRSMFFVVAVFLFLLVPQMVFAADVTYVIAEGEFVSGIVKKLTDSPNWQRNGIKVLTKRGKLVPKDQVDRVLPDWQVVIDESLIKTQKIAGSAGKTLVQICEDSSKPNCVRRLARLNGIPKRRVVRPLVADVYALPELVPSLSASKRIDKPAEVVPAPAPSAFVPVTVPTAPVSVTPPAAAVPKMAVPVVSVPQTQPKAKIIVDPPAAQNPIWSYLTPMSVVTGVVVIAFLGIGVTSAQKKISQYRAEARERQVSIAEEERRATIQTKMKEFASRFEAAFQRGLNFSSNAVEMNTEYDFPHQRFRTRVMRVKGTYPNLSNHAENLRHDLEVIGQELSDLPFTIGEPVEKPTGVVIPFAYNGGK